MDLQNHVTFHYVILPSAQIGEFGIVYKAYFKRYVDSETEVVAVKTLKDIN